MTDDATKSSGPEAGAQSDDTFAWTEPEQTSTGAAGQGPRVGQPSSRP